MFGLFLIVLGVVGIYAYRRFVQDRPTDRPAIEDYAEQNSLRIVSVTRSQNYWRYFGYHFSGYLFRERRTRGISGLARLYDVVVVNSEGDRGSLHVVFDPFLGPQMNVLYSKGPALIPPQTCLLRPDVSSIFTSHQRQRGA
jgi:hypothetical protein